MMHLQVMEPAKKAVFSSKQSWIGDLKLRPLAQEAKEQAWMKQPLSPGVLHETA